MNIIGDTIASSLSTYGSVFLLSLAIFWVFFQAYEKASGL